MLALPAALPPTHTARPCEARGIVRAAARAPWHADALTRGPELAVHIRAALRGAAAGSAAAHAPSMCAPARPCSRRHWRARISRPRPRCWSATGARARSRRRCSRARRGSKWCLPCGRAVAGPARGPSRRSCTYRTSCRRPLVRPAPAPDLYAGMRALPVLSAGTAHSLIRGSGAIAQEAGRAGRSDVPAPRSQSSPARCAHPAVLR